jgi:hypothetical protein
VLRWIVLHWFELGTLCLLSLNLWFVAKVLRALAAVNHWLTFLARWFDFDRTQGDRQPYRHQDVETAESNAD